MTDAAKKSHAHRKLTYILLAACALMLAAAVAVWLFSDEAPLDYSSMDVALGPQDPAVNGYTRLREIAENMPQERPEIERVRELSDPFYPHDEPLATEQIQEVLKNRRSFLQAMADAHAMDSFQFDQEATYLVLLPELSAWQTYTILRSLEARALGQKGEVDAALAQLIKTTQELRIYTKSAQISISVYQAMACAKVLNAEIAYLLWRHTPSKEALREALRDYALTGIFRPQYGEALKGDFQMAKSFVEDLPDDPKLYETMFGETKVPVRLMMLSFKPNRTLNESFGFYVRRQGYITLPLEQQEPLEDQLLVELKTQGSDWERVLAGNWMGERMMNLLVSGSLGHRVAEVDFDSMATQLMLAIRLYQLEHGVLPPTLEALVLDYIAVVPTDPFDGQPIRYDPARAILYSVGMDGVDDGGSSYMSVFDRDHPDFEAAEENGELAHLDEDEPTFHIRFDQQPASQDN